MARWKVVLKGRVPVLEVHEVQVFLVSGSELNLCRHT